MFRSVLILFVVLLSQTVGSWPADAQSLVEGRRNRGDREERGERRALTLDQAVRMAERRYKARMRKAETVTDGDRVIYVIRLHDDDSGRVWTVRVDAQTGSMR